MPFGENKSPILKGVRLKRATCILFSLFFLFSLFSFLGFQTASKTRFAAPRDASTNMPRMRFFRNPHGSLSITCTSPQKDTHLAHIRTPRENSPHLPPLFFWTK